jgi:endoglucanase
MTNFCQQNEFIAKNDDVIVGFVGWGAGGFDSTYVLTLTPTKSGNTWTDNKLMKQCILAPFGKAAIPVTTTTTTSATPTSTDKPTEKTTSAAPAGTKGNNNANEAAPDKDNGVGRIAVSNLCIILASMVGFHLYFG